MINEGYLLLLHINLQQVFAIFFNTIIIGDLLSDPTIVIIIEVVVEELCSRTVTNTPIIKPATGLDNISLPRNTCPAVLPINYQNNKDFFII